MVRRRFNLQGYQLKAMTESLPPFIEIDLKDAQLDQINNVYDVTNVTHGMNYDILVTLEEHINFTTTLLKRKDNVWGSVEDFGNGTVRYSGMIESLEENIAEMINTGYTQTPERFKALDVLFPTFPLKWELFIQDVQDEAFTWTTYVSPFSTHLWMTIVGIAIVKGG